MAMRNALLLCTLFCLALMAAPPAYAQFDLIFGVDLALELTPAHPAPGERLHARARSSLLDLSETQLRWSANGKPIAEGIGVTEVDVTAGALGSETQLTVTALENALEFSSAEATIAPVELDLLWEADSYVPPFYRGRALPSAGTNLRLEAIPRFVRSGSSVPLRDIIFTWKRDGYVIAAASGRGKSKATVESPPLFASETISVEAKTSDGRLQGVASARISSQEPHVALYENDPVFGIAYHRALARENQIPEIETTFAAVPYFAEAASPDDTALIYNWRVNDIGIANDPEHPSGLTINASGSSGSALIELLLKHATNLFINAPGSWLVNFQSAGAQAPFVGSE